MKPLVIIAAGGTGGHMFPAQALAEALLARGWRVRLSTDTRGATYTSGYPKAVAVDVLPSATFARGGVVAKAMVPFRILGGVLLAVWQFLGDRPMIVVGFGGYPAIPAIAAALFLRLPRLLHEQNGVPGRVNQFFARRVHMIACGTWPTELPKGVTSTYTGNPLRQMVLERAGAPYTPPGKGRLNLLVLGGSQGSQVVSRAVLDAIARLPDAVRARLRVSQQARPEDHQHVRERYCTLGIDVEIQSFFADISNRIAASQLVISRAGASSVADIAVIGRPAVFIPLAQAIRDEQTANARGLVEVGAAVVVQEKDLRPELLARHIKEVLTDPARAKAMAAASLSLGRPDAADRLAVLVENLSLPQQQTLS